MHSISFQSHQSPNSLGAVHQKFPHHTDILIYFNFFRSNSFQLQRSVGSERLCFVDSSSFRRLLCRFPLVSKATLSILSCFKGNFVYSESFAYTSTIATVLPFSQRLTQAKEFPLFIISFPCFLPCKMILKYFGFDSSTFDAIHVFAVTCAMHECFII